MVHDYQPSKGYDLDTRLQLLVTSAIQWLLWLSSIDPKKTRVEYTVDVRIGGWIGIIESIGRAGSKSAQWVKSPKKAR